MLRNGLTSMLQGNSAANFDSIEALEKIAEVEFVLKNIRQDVGTGFVDRLVLELSDEIKCEKPRVELAKSVLGMTEYSPLSEDIFYLHIDRIPQERHALSFFKIHDGQIFGADVSDVVGVARKLFEKVDGIAEHQYSLCMNVSVDGLDYFSHCKAKKHGRLYVVEDQIVPPKPHFYSTTYQDSHGIKHWLLSMASPRN